MQTLKGKIALVNGASRGVGKGIALVLGEAGATVYITGRTEAEGKATVPLEGTVYHTAEAVTAAGGRGVAAPCDHGDDVQVRAVFEQIKQEQGRLDILVNNAWAGYEGYHANTHLPPDVPFWEKPLAFWDANLVGVRWAYIASALAAPVMVEQGGGLIVMVSYSPLTLGNPAYNVAKSATDRLGMEMAHHLRDQDVAVVSLHPGLVRTEGVLLNAQYFDMSNAESPQFTGRAVLALAGDVAVMEKTGQAFQVARLADQYDFDDIDGTRPHPIG